MHRVPFRSTLLWILATLFIMELAGCESAGYDSAQTRAPTTAYNDPRT